MTSELNLLSIFLLFNLWVDSFFGNALQWRPKISRLLIISNTAIYVPSNRFMHELSPSGVLPILLFLFLPLFSPSVRDKCEITRCCRERVKTATRSKSSHLQKGFQLKASNTSSHNKFLIYVLYKIKRKAFTKGSWYAHIKVNAFFPTN